MPSRPARGHRGRLPEPAPKETMTLAAEGLDALLAALPSSGSRRDRRVRQAILAASSALRDGRDPQAAIEATYHQ